MDRRQEIEEELREIDELNVATLANLCHDVSDMKGWHDLNRSFGDICSLFHSEISEALEEHREGHEPSFVYVQKEDHKEGVFFSSDSELWENLRFLRGFSNGHKPEGIPIELADVIIRILDYCVQEDINIMEAIRYKIVYNLRREHLHGDKKI